MFLIFDLDDTLYDLADPFYRAHKEVIPKHWELDSRELFKKSRVHADEISSQSNLRNVIADLRSTLKAINKAEIIIKEKRCSCQREHLC